MRLEPIDTYGPTWRTLLDELYQQLGGGANATLLPYHFLQAAFPHIGGQICRLLIDDETVGIFFLLPHPAPSLEDAATAPLAYIARCHYLAATAFDAGQLQALLCQALNTPHVTLYDPQATHTYTATTHAVGALDIGRPSYAEAEAIRLLQQQIWGSPPEYLYPLDIHSSDFPLGTTLVARVNEAVAGFLFGFYKAGGPALPGDWQQRWHGDLRIESQVMGVLPAYRGLRIGYLLKRFQAEQALAEGIGIIHWTVDPLQYPNAALNFGLLRAVAFIFTPDYYAFRNELNRGPASRFSLTWLIGSARVQGKPLHDARSAILHLAQHPEIGRVNQGWQHADLSATAPMLAIEIPADWTGLQKAQPDEALEWRATTDRLFAHYIGSTPGKYVVTDVGVDEERRYLIMQQVTEYLWQRLEET
jgi:predicted GNAT superfamily acetyltransferase